jgi:hypothetical protein
VTTRRRNLTALLLLGAAAIAGGYFAGAPRPALRAFDAVPQGSFLVITVDLERVRRSGVMAELGFVGRGELDDISRTCGFDPLDHAREAAIAVPEGGEPGDFGVAVVVDLSREQVVTCATRVLEARGAIANVHDEDGYMIVEEHESGSKNARIALKEGSPLFIGRGLWLREMMRAFDGRGARAAAKKDGHAALRETVGGSGAALTITAILPPELRARLRDEVDMGQKPGGPTFNAVLSVREAAASVRAGDDAGKDALLATAVCDTPEACGALRDFLEKKRKAVAGDLGVRLIGLGAALDDMRIEAHGSAVQIALTASAPEIARAVRRGFGAQALAGKPSPRAGDAATPAPDEVIDGRDR